MIEPTDDDERTNSRGLFNTVPANSELSRLFSWPVSRPGFGITGIRSALQIVISASSITPCFKPGPRSAGGTNR